MGWLNKLTQKFQEPIDKTEEIKLENLQEWLNIQSELVHQSVNINEDFSTYIKKLKDRRWYLEAQLDLWKEKAPEQIKKEVVTIFRDTKLFLNNLTFPEQANLKYLLGINQDLLTKSEQLVKVIENSELISSFSFMVDKESKDQQLVNPLFQELLNLSTLVKNFENLLVKKGFRTMDSLKEKVNKLEQSNKRIILLQKQLEERKMRLEMAISKKREKEEDLSKLTELPTYKLIEKIQKIKEKKEDLNDSIYSIFSKLKPVLKEYVATNQNPLANAYLEDPATAFYDDDDLAVIHILGHLKAMLSAERSHLAASERNLLLREIADITVEKLQQLQKQIINLKKEMENLEDGDLDYEVTTKVEDIKYRLDHYQKQVIRMQKDIVDIEEWLEQLNANLSKEKDLFQDIIKVGLGKTIKFSP
jgi:hypothetical protein